MQKCKDVIVLTVNCNYLERKNAKTQSTETLHLRVLLCKGLIVRGYYSLSIKIFIIVAAE